MNSGAGWVRGYVYRPWHGWLMVLFGVLFLWGQAVRPLTDSTEARYAEIAREMTVSGDWLTPTLDGIPHLAKPPLTVWTMALSMSVLGANEAAARLPNLLAFLVTVLLVARLARALGRPEASGWAALLYGLSAGPILAWTFPSTDTLLTLFETGAVLAYLEHRNGARGARWLFFAALGACFLTKGPPGLLVPAAVILGDRLLRKREERPVDARPLLSHWAGWGLFALIGLGWYAAMIAVRPQTFGYWIRVEVVDRVASSSLQRDQSPLIYLAALAGGLLPWWFLVPGFLKRRLPAFLDRWRGGAWPVLLAWFVLPLIVFTVSKSRLALYVLPLFPAVILALALDRPRPLRLEPGRWFGLPREFFLAYAAVWMIVSWVSVPLAAHSSWKGAAGRLERTLPPGPVELVVFRETRLHSLSFYLRTRADVVAWDARDARDGRSTLAEKLASLQAAPGDSVGHLFVARAGRARTLRERLDRRAQSATRHRRYEAIYLPPPIHPAVGPAGPAADRPRFVTPGR